MGRTVIWVALGAALGMALIWGLTNWLKPYALHGSVIQEEYAAPDFALPDGRGGEFRLSQQKGSLVLVFFGYTACPDVCPTTLSSMKRIASALGKDASRLRVVFITVDPERDTPEKSAEYAAAFNPEFYGLSGSEEQLAPIWKDYGVFRALNKKDAADTIYTVDHTSQIYLVDAAGNLRLTYSFGTPVQDIIQDLQYLLRKG